MCLGVPGRVVDVDGLTAIVDFWGIRRETRLDVIDEEVPPGDHILNTVGFAIRKITARRSRRSPPDPRMPTPWRRASSIRPPAWVSSTTTWMRSCRR